MVLILYYIVFKREEEGRKRGRKREGRGGRERREEKGRERGEG